ncbi:unnamed protein product [Polarella glacialis]|uniref:CSD domain-containing protein n=1 Tax=Polarella glacialis TaxID=89957 RepID=A0A813JFZ5_POLGL|nr:unnamed protein product [Polarella glacialis]CAE8676047.1 unnamed protein product [Polarella glacialis]
MAFQGTVKVWNDEKGFGFITPFDGSEDNFVHRSSLVGCDALAQGDVVMFDTEYDDRKGKTRAINVSGGTGENTFRAALVGKGKGGGGGDYGGGKGGGYESYGPYGGGKQGPPVLWGGGRAMGYDSYGGGKGGGGYDTYGGGKGSFGKSYNPY